MSDTGLTDDHAPNDHAPSSQTSSDHTASSHTPSDHAPAQPGPRPTGPARDALVALRTGCHILVATQGVDLSMRQIAILLTVYLAPDEPTVRGLSATLEISKPAVSRALDRLCDLGLVRRKTDQKDRRNVLVQRTVKGSVFLNDLGEILADAFTSSARHAA